MCFRVSCEKGWNEIVKLLLNYPKVVEYEENSTYDCGKTKYGYRKYQSGLKTAYERNNYKIIYMILTKINIKKRYRNYLMKSIFISSTQLYPRKLNLTNNKRDLFELLISDKQLNHAFDNNILIRTLSLYQEEHKLISILLCNQNINNYLNQIIFLLMIKQYQTHIQEIIILPNDLIILLTKIINQLSYQELTTPELSDIELIRYGLDSNKNFINYLIKVFIY